MKRTQLAAALGVVALSLSGLTACGSDDEPAAKEKEKTQEQEPCVPSEFDLQVADGGKVGDIVVDGDCRTVYRFDNDTADPSKSNCAGDCAKDWEPVLDPGQVGVIDGIDTQLIGAIERSDGKVQMTLAGWPLYHYVGDKDPVSLAGQGTGAVWWVLDPSGERITTLP